MPVVFDDGAADSLIDAASHAASELRDQGILRRGAVETAADDFNGVYGQLFTQACATESEDRGKLGGLLDALADQVREAKERAKSEKTRREQLAAWNERETVRERLREQHRQGPASGLLPWDTFVFDPKPLEMPFPAPVISAAFAARLRNRAASEGSSGGKSSADPDRLRTYVDQSRASNLRMGQELTRIKTAWTGFARSCSWARIESDTFVRGFDRLLGENESDATWIAHVASAFEAAGNTILTNQALKLASTAVSKMTDDALLKALATLPANELTAMLAASPGLQAQVGLIDPVRINEWWTGLNPSPEADARFSDQQALLLSSSPVVFGNLEGLPYGARDYANQLALVAGISRFKEQEAGLLETGSVSRYGTPARWAEALEKVQVQLTALLDIQKALTTRFGAEPRYLVSMTQDQPPLAAVSIGDLDSATNITYAVPGMGATTDTSMNEWTKSSQNLHKLLPGGSAVVAWIGYKTPPVPSALGDFGVLDVNYAVGGGNKLVASLGGISAVRRDSTPRLNILAHSYGTTTAAVALSRPGVHVENFITLGSAGLPDSLQTASDLNATHVYSGHSRSVIPGLEDGKGDQWAWTGRDFSRDHHVDPISPDFGSHAFGTDTGGDTGLPVTDHSTSVGENGSGYLDPNTESLWNVMYALRGEPEKMSPYVPKGPTDLQRYLEEVASSENYSL